MARIFTSRPQASSEIQARFTALRKWCFSWRTVWVSAGLLAVFLAFMVYSLMFSRPNCIYTVHDLLEGQTTQEDAWFCLDGRMRSANPDKTNWFTKPGQDVTIDFADRSLTGEWLVVYGITYTDQFRRDRVFVTLDNQGYVSSLVTR